MGLTVGFSAVAGVLLPLLLAPEMKHRIELDLRHFGAAHPGMVPGALSPAGAVMLGVFAVSSPILYLMMAGASMGKHRWKWLVLLVIVVGSLGITLFVPGDFIARWRPLSLFSGLVWFLSGAATLVSYLRHTDSPATQAE